MYDPKKSFLAKPTEETEQVKQDSDEDEQLEDSVMEDLSSHQEPMKKAKSAHPALLKLAASPNKIEQTKMNYSKVYLKRDHLYSELKSIPVTVE